MNIKRILFIILAVAIVVGVVFAIVNVKKQDTLVSSNDHLTEKLKVVSSNFASYDFLRAIIGETENVELTFLLGPGKDAHSYDPTASDLIKIQNADLFVYVGGEMEGWADRVIESLDNKDIAMVCIADYVETMEEQEVDGAEEEEEEEEEGAFDEHIWTSPENAVKMVNALEESMERLDQGNREKYRENADKYIAQVKEVDSKIQNIVDNKVRNRLLFGDKMPMQYFMDYYGLEVSAAFSGCSTETEPSAQTIAYLIGKAKEENIPVILYIELSSGKVAKVIADEVGNGCCAMQIQTLHNVSLDDFNRGETWVSLMNRNLDVLRAALQ